MSTPDGGRRADKQGHRKRKQNDGEKKDGANKRTKKGWQNDGGKKDGREVLNVEQLGWKGVSFENDEFDDFEELEGIDVDYVDVNGSKIVQFKRVGDKPGQPASKPKEHAKIKNDKKEKTSKGKKEQIDKAGDKEWSGIPSSSQKEDNTEAAAEDDEGQSPNSNPFTDLLQLQEKVDLPAWSAMSLSTPTLQALQALSFTTPTAIQSLAIPRIIQGHDLIGKASTGSGKTLAFGIPILEHVLSLADHKERSHVALIVAPTRELSKQIVGHLEDIAKYSLGAMTVVNITGGLSVQKQIRILEKKPSVLVGTPGRLWEVFNSHEGKDMDLSASLKKIQFLVLDEADRLLQDGHFKEVEHILEFVKGGEDKQTLVFSATFQKNLQQKLKGKRAFEGNLMSKDDALEFLLQKIKFREQPPRFVDANPDTAVASLVHEGIIECDNLEKDLFLYYFLLRYPGRTLVFVNSIDAVRRIVPILQSLHIEAHALHSQKVQKQRLQSLERFRSSPTAIMVATDIAARGLDIPAVKHVVHYHLPRTADTYVHRSGRTARGTEEGVSLLLCSPAEQRGLRALLVKLGKAKRVERVLEAFPVDRVLISRLKPRINLAQKVVNAGIEVQKRGHQEKWMSEAAGDLGVDEEELTRVINSKGKYGKQKPEEASKEQVKVWKEELEGLLVQPLMAGISARYLTSGSINHAERLLKGGTHETFLEMDVSSALSDIRRKKAKML